jgi:hypothetical protein
MGRKKARAPSHNLGPVEHRQLHDERPEHGDLLAGLLAVDEGHEADDADEPVSRPAKRPRSVAAKEEGGRGEVLVQLASGEGAGETALWALGGAPMELDGPREHVEQAQSLRLRREGPAEDVEQACSIVLEAAGPRGAAKVRLGGLV